MTASDETKVLTWEETEIARKELRCDLDDVLLQTIHEHPMPSNVSPIGHEEVRTLERGCDDDPYTRLENERIAIKVGLERRKLVASMAAQIAGHLAAAVIMPKGVSEDDTTQAIATSSIALADAICDQLQL
jgi:hypothetical protein